MISFEEKAKNIYKNSKDKIRNKAISAGIAMDNALKRNILKVVQPIAIL